MGRHMENRFSLEEEKELTHSQSIKYLFEETILDMREFYPEGEDIGMYHLRRRLILQQGR